MVGNYRATQIEPLVCVTEFASNSSMQEEDEDNEVNKHNSLTTDNTSKSNNNSQSDDHFRFDNCGARSVAKTCAEEGGEEASGLSSIPLSVSSTNIFAVSKLSPIQLNLTPVSPTLSPKHSPFDPNRLPSPLLNPPSASGSNVASPASGGSAASIALPVTPTGGGCERHRRKIERNTSAPLPGMLAVSVAHRLKMFILLKTERRQYTYVVKAPSRKFLTPTSSDGGGRNAKDHMTAKKRASGRKHGQSVRPRANTLLIMPNNDLGPHQLITYYSFHKERK